jgi:tetratricopeptide (TPR) repeat protein
MNHEESEEIKKLTKIPNIGFLRAKTLYEAGFTSLHDIAQAKEETLASIPGIGKKTAKKIMNTIKSIGVEQLNGTELEEELIEDEFECPMCGTILSAYEAECYECGTPLKKAKGDEHDKDKALAVYNRKLKINPKDSEIWYARAVLLSDLGQLEQAIISYDKVIEIDPQLEGVWHAKADAYTKMGQHANAAEALKSAMKQTLLNLKGVEPDILEKKTATPVTMVSQPSPKPKKDIPFISAEEMGADLDELEGLMLDAPKVEDIPVISPEEMAADLEELKLVANIDERSEDFIPPTPPRKVWEDDYEESIDSSRRRGSDLDEPEFNVKPEPAKPKKLASRPQETSFPTNEGSFLGKKGVPTSFEQSGLEEAAKVEEPEQKLVDEAIDELEALSLDIEKELDLVPMPKPAPPPSRKPDARPTPSPARKPAPTATPVAKPKTLLEEIDSMDFDNILLDLEEAMIKEHPSCPVCKQLIDSSAEICINCNTVIKAKPKIKPVAAAKPGLKTTLDISKKRLPNERMDKRLPTLPAVIGRVNGLVNGFVNGIINGDGFINGRVNGLTNGRVNGLTNGRTNGFINGVGYLNGLSVRKRERIKVMKRKTRIYDTVLLSTILVMLLTTSISLIIFYPTTEDRIIIDGYFSDWDDYKRYWDDEMDAASQIDITAISYYKNTYTLKFYLEVRGELFAGQNGGVDALYLFIDTDGDRANGYEVDGIGADLMLEITGWNGIIRSTQAYRFDHSYRTDTIRSRDDWSGWSPMSGAKADSGTSVMEAQIPYRTKNGNNGFELSFLFKTIHLEDGLPVDEDLTPVMSSQYSQTTITQESEAQSNLPVGSYVELLDIAFEPQGRITIDELAIKNHGIASTQTLQNIGLYGGSTLLATPTVAGDTLHYQIPGGHEITGDAFLSLGAAFPLQTHEVIGLKLDWIAGQLAATVEDFVPIKSYIGGPPAGIVIDGAFDDWISISSNIDTDNNLIRNPSIDIVDTKDANTTDDLFFYMETQGAIMLGELIPNGAERKMLPPPEPTPSPGPAPSPGPSPSPSPAPDIRPRDGRDLARIYLTRPLSGESYLIEVSGKFGEIKESVLYEVNGTGWNYLAEVQAANGGSKLEISVPSLHIGSPLQNMLLRYEMTDWLGHTDRAENQTTRRSILRNLARSTRTPPDTPWPDDGDWLQFCIDTSDTNSIGASINVPNPSLNITGLSYVNSTEYLYIQMETANNTQDWLTNGTWMLFIDVDGDGAADWLVKENSTGLMYFYNWTTGSEGTWTWNYTETLSTTDEGGGVTNQTSNGYWMIEFALNKSILTNASVQIGNYTTIGAATNSTEDFVVNGTSYQCTMSNLISGGEFEDIAGPIQIPEMRQVVIPFLGTLILAFAFMRKRQHKVFKQNSQSHATNSGS